MLRLSQGDVASATLDFAEASRLAPGWSTPREYRADTHRLQSEFEQAIDEYTRTIELEPGNLSAYVGRALAWMEKQELEKARQDFERGLETGRRMRSGILSPRMNCGCVRNSSLRLWRTLIRPWRLILTSHPGTIRGRRSIFICR